jgi:hypothetical protein
MKKIILVYGLIAGAITGGMLLITMPLYENGTLKIENGEWLGYTTMVVALSLVFFGVKSYRDNHLSGVISFGNALKIGLLISLVAAVIYALSWEVTMLTMKGDFAKQYGDKYIEKLKQENAPQEKIDKAKKEMEEFAIKYRNPVIRFSITMAEILPVGFIISVASAGILRRKNFLPPAENSAVNS